MRTLVPFGLLALLALPHTAALQSPLPAECQPMLTAGEKQFTVPSHAL